MDNTTRKAELYEAREQYRQELESQVNDLKAKTAQIGKTVLIVGGAFAGAYLLYNLLFSDKKSAKKQKQVIQLDNDSLPVKVKEEDEEDSWIVRSIKTYILSFLMVMAREKLSAALQFIKEAEEK
jgi:DNA polymerase elongation subunit (family B)